MFLDDLEVFRSLAELLAGLRHVFSLAEASKRLRLNEDRTRRAIEKSCRPGLKEAGAKRIAGTFCTGRLQVSFAPHATCSRWRTRPKRGRRSSPFRPTGC